MSTNNKWQALSMSERAFLIREAVRNGITDISSIRDTWEHRFDGESSQPTEDEYIAQRAKESIYAALDKAYNRIETVVPVFGEKTEADRIKQVEELEKAKSLYNMYKTFKQKIDRGELTSVDFGFEHLDKKQINKALSEAEAKLMHATYMHDADKLVGPGCVATSMDNYGKDCISNQQFAKNSEKYGFVKIDNREIKPGDIVQFDRKHMLMSNTQSTNNQGELTNPLNMRYSGSNGYDVVRKGSRYPADWKDIEAYRFVGDKADSLQWKKEYREKYGHQFSGEEDHSEHGVQHELKKAKPVHHNTSDYSFWDVVKVHALNSSSMDHPHPTPQIFDTSTQAKALRHDNKETVSDMWGAQLVQEKDFAPSKLKSAKTGLMIAAATANPYGLVGDLGLTLADATSTAAIDGDFSNYVTDFATSAGMDIVTGPIFRMGKALRQAMRPLPKAVTGIRTTDDAIRFGAQTYKTHINPNANVDDLVSRTSLASSNSLGTALGNYDSSTGKILINNEGTRSSIATTSVHEYRHADDIGIHPQYDDQNIRPLVLDENLNIIPDRSNPTLSLNDEEIKYLRKTYPINKSLYPDADDLAEPVAINAGNIAYAQQLYIKIHNKLPSKQELQNFISSLNAEQLGIVRIAGGGYPDYGDLVRQYVMPWRMKNAMLNIK